MGKASGSVSRRALLGMFIASVMLAVAVPSVALAATASFSSVSPKRGSITMVATPKISVTVYDKYGAKGSGAITMWVDGKRVTPTCSYIVKGSWNPRHPDYRRFKLTYQVPSALSAGTHTVTVKIYDKKHKTSKYSWTFMVDAASDPATFSALTPAQSSSSQVNLPRISANVAERWDVKGAGSYSMTIDGQPVAAAIAYNGSYKNFAVSYQVVTALTPGVHTVVVRVHDAAERTTATTWSFTVIAPDPVFVEMPAGGATCADCHFGYPAAHPMTNCEGCHGANAPVGPPAYTAGNSESAHTLACTLGGCHGDEWTGPTPQHPLDANCTRCHNAMSTVAKTHVVDAQTLKNGHIAGASSCTANFCHATSLTAEHYRRTVGGKPFTCETCHESTNADVVAAIAAGDKDCAACHKVTNHTAIHVVDRSDTCVGAKCHVATNANLTTLHPTCDTCHSSTDPDVVAAIAGNHTACASCHDFTNHDAKHEVVRNDSCVGPLCHVSFKTNLMTLHPTCATCHTSTDADVIAAIASDDTACASCHDFTDHTALHDVSDRADTCRTCHPGTNLMTIDKKVGAPSARHANCVTCHGPDSRQDVKDAIAGSDTRCSACHDFLDHIALHDVSDREDTCTTCHPGTNLGTIEKKPGSPSAVHATCATCHESTDADVVKAISDRNTLCSACHDFPDHLALHAVNANDATCLGCHPAADADNPDLTTVHSGDCASCHESENLRVRTAISDHLVRCSACHDEDLGNHIAKHDVADRTDFCATCHAGTNLTAIDKTSGVQSTKHADCATCHENTGDAVKGAIAAKDLTCTRCHGTAHESLHAVVPDAECVDCHAGTNLQAIEKSPGVASTKHADCATCHGATARQDVKDAIVAGGAVCDDCHAGHDVPAIHVVAENPACVDCHAGTVLNVIEKSPGVASTKHAACITCHSATVRKQVKDAIAAGGAVCVDCHAVPHDVPAIHPVATNPACVDCHAGTVLNVIEKSPGVASTKHAACITCHSATVRKQVKDAIAAGGAVCVDCHAVPHDVPAIHVVVPDFDCVSCHTGTQLTVIEKSPGVASTKHAACITCHSATVRKQVKDAIAAGGAVCVDCHAVPHDVPAI
ncbi:MAG TPA: hypothetical protein VIL17_07335, partial [Coriobacteriia bacterium]